MTPRELENITFGIELEGLAPVRDFSGNPTFANGIGCYHCGRQIAWLPAGWNVQHDGSIAGRMHDELAKAKDEAKAAVERYIREIVRDEVARVKRE